MSSAYTQSYKYRDPEKLDISTLGNAMTYKQQNYDVNTAQTQQLINQYAGTDLLRDIDKQYFGERLNTLVKYINESGTRDWSRKSVANEIQNYVSTALDKNVMNAIASTQSFRKQQAEIEDIKKNKPDLYSMQNEWFATQDYERYMKSGVVGDTYKAQSYVPYTDVTKEILKNADFYKQFGAEVRYDVVGGNAYFTQLGKTETLSPEEAKNLIAMTLGDKGKTQLMIDGLYNYKGIKDVNVVRQQYTDALSNQKNQYQSQIESTTALMAGASKKEKEALNRNLQAYKQKAGEIENSITNSDKLSRDSMIYTMHSSNFLNQWGNAMSYKKVTDLTIDDSGYKTAKFNWDVKSDIWDQKFKKDQAEIEQIRWQQEYDLKNKIAITKGEIDSNGNPIIRGINPNIAVTENSLTTKDDVKAIDPVGIINEFGRDYDNAAILVKQDIDRLRETDQGRKKLQQVFGTDSNQPTDRLTFLLMGKNQVAQERFSDLKKSNSLSPQSISAIEKGQNSFSKKLYLDKQLKGVEDRVEDIARRIVGTKETDNFYGLSGNVIDRNGNVVSGNYVGKNSTSYDNMYGYSKIGAKLGIIQSILREDGGKMSDLEKQQLVVLKNNLIAKLPKNQREKALTAYGETSYWQGVKDNFSAIGNVISAGYNLAKASITGDSQDRKALKESLERYGNSKFTFIPKSITNWVSDIGNRKYDLEDLNSNDLGSGWAGIDSEGYSKNGDNLLQELSMNIKNIDQNLQKYNTQYTTNTFTLNTEDKFTKSIMANIQALAPDRIIAPNSAIQFVIDPQTQTASVSMMVKQGKDIVPISIENVKANNLPPALMSRIDTQAQNFRYDPQANSEPDPFYFRGDFYDSKKEIVDKFGSTDINALDNHFTKQDIVDQINIRKGPEFLQRNAKDIKELLNDSISFEGQSVNGKYVLDLKTNDGIILDRKIMGRNVYEEKNLIEQASDKIASEAIIQYILKTMK